MTRRDPRVTLALLLDHAREAVAISRSRVRGDLDGDRLFALAAVRLLEMIGEGVTRLPEDVRERHPDVPWREMVALRNRLIHGYDDVDHDIVWRILSDELPALVERLERGPS